MKIRRKREKYLFFLLLFIVVCCFFGSNTVYAKTNDTYLVLVEQKDGSFKRYENMIEVSDYGNLMIRAIRIAKALKFSYQKNQSNTFEIKKSHTNYILFQNNTKEYLYAKSNIQYHALAMNQVYISQKSGNYVCSISALEPLVHFRYFHRVKEKEYEAYAGVICYSRYHDIPDSVPITLEKQDETIELPQRTEPDSYFVNQVEFIRRKQFLTVSKVLSDWDGTNHLWLELKKRIDGSIVPSTKLWIEKNRIGFSHQGIDFPGVYLSKGNQGYILSIHVKLKGSVTASQSASIVKAMLFTISSTPMEVYDAIMSSFLSTKNSEINTKEYHPIGDSKLMVSVKDGVVSYYIRENKQLK